MKYLILICIVLASCMNVSGQSKSDTNRVFQKFIRIDIPERQLYSVYDSLQRLVLPKIGLPMLKADADFWSDFILRQFDHITMYGRLDSVEVKKIKK